MPNLSSSVSSDNIYGRALIQEIPQETTLREELARDRDRSRSPKRSRSTLEIEADTRTVNESSRSQPNMATESLIQEISEYQEVTSDNVRISVADDKHLETKPHSVECLKPENASKDSKELVLPNRPDLVFISDEHEVKSKLNQRRLSRNGRYYTADAIHDVKRDKDPSIHKRLSWNFGTPETSLEDRKTLRAKAFSSDSLMSMPSSSGVSSTQSLHGVSDLIEEHEDDDSYMGELRITQTSGHIVLQLEDPYGDDAHTESTTDGADEGGTPLDRNSKTMSKSMPDIGMIGDFTTGEVKDGIASVEVPDVNQQRRKMTHAQILKMKKQLLLNSTVEAS